MYDKVGLQLLSRRSWRKVSTRSPESVSGSSLSRYSKDIRNKPSFIPANAKLLLAYKIKHILWKSTCSLTTNGKFWKLNSWRHNGCYNFWWSRAKSLTQWKHTWSCCNLRYNNQTEPTGKQESISARVCIHRSAVNMFFALDVHSKVSFSLWLKHKNDISCHSQNA